MWATANYWSRRHERADEEAACHWAVVAAAVCTVELDVHGGCFQFFHLCCDVVVWVKKNHMLENQNGAANTMFLHRGENNRYNYIPEM